MFQNWKTVGFWPTYLYILHCSQFIKQVSMFIAINSFILFSSFA